MKQDQIARIKKSFSADSSRIHEEVADFVRDTLTQLGITKKLCLKTVLLCEETTVQFLRRAPKDSSLLVQVKRFFGETLVTLSMPGEAFDPYKAEEDDSEDAIRALLFRSFGENYKYKNQHHVNRVRIRTNQSDQSMLYYTLLAILLGLLFGCLTKFLLPAAAAEAICHYALTPVKTVFMNSLKIIIAPVVFFSIVTCFSQFQSVAELGRLGAKVMGMYLLTTVVAVLLGIGVYSAFQPGQWGFALSGAPEIAAVSVDTNVDTSLLSTIVNIVPSNFLQPFVESDTLQIIFLAFICGVAVGMIGEYSTVLRELFEALNSMFLTITAMFAGLIPLAVFASISLLIVETGGDSLLSVLGLFGVFVLAILLMLCVYGLLVLGLGRLNPITFFRKNREGILTSFTLCSSSAAMPTNLQICTEKLGISPKVSNFSIPLGATVNMDGMCIFLTTCSLFLARAYSAEVPVSALFSLAVTIILLSLGAPGVPGAGLVCLGVALRAINVPVEAIGLIIAIEPIMDMFITMNNTTGDVTAALVVAKSENLVDEELYRSN